MREQSKITGRTATGAAAAGDSVPAFPDELAYLEEVKRALHTALREHDAAVERYDRDYREQQRYIMDYRHEIDPKEIFQSSLALEEIDWTGAFAVQLRDKVAKLTDSPYFARIDFRQDHEETPALVYIGRFAFSESEDCVIYDWRAPISSMFYDCETGRAAYVAPMGTVEGELSRKRQFRIAGGEMEYCLESAVNIQDDVLQRELSRTADEKMKTIIATIQREQNRIIRDEQADVLVIQGVAGSGKTSIALHRVAYLLYRYKERLSARNVVILSPNKVFGDYIAGVLPELGEEPIYQISFADIAAIQIDERMRFEPAIDPVEAADEQWAARVRFKSTLGFVRRMDAYLEWAVDHYFEPRDYGYGGFTVPAAFIRERYAAYGKHPVRRRLEEIADDILSRFHSQNGLGQKPPQLRSVVSALKAMFGMRNTLQLYRDFFTWMGEKAMLVMPAKNTLEWADVYPYLYFQSAFEGLKENRIIRHLVVDEMQDYTPAQYAVINRLFRCKKTILGDFGQVVNPHHLCGLEDLEAMYPGVRTVRLNTSYRSTCEIIRFAQGILDGVEIEPVERHGAPVELLRCADAEDELAAVRDEIDLFRERDGNTMGIVVKTRAQAEALYRELGDLPDVHLLDAGSERFAGGISIACIQMSKGLEFDEVVVCGVDAGNYHSSYDRNLLYIACTRAMHRLTLTCGGAPSPLIPEL